MVQRTIPTQTIPGDTVYAMQYQSIGCLNAEVLGIRPDEEA